MRKSPDDSADVSRAESGDIATPTDVTQVEVENSADEIIGLLELWDTGQWLYVPVEDLSQTEPARDEDDPIELGDTSPPDVDDTTVERSGLPDNIHEEFTSWTEWHNK